MEGRAYGAGWSVVWVGRPGDREQVRSAAEVELAAIDAATSTWRADSELARLTPGAPVSSALAGVLAVALEVARASGGAYDPTVRPLVDLWRPDHHPRATPPSPDEIEAARARVGWERVRGSPSTGGAVDLGGATLDLSGVAPGCAADRIAASLDALGLPDHLVDVGGELRAGGSAPGGGPWTVDLVGPAGRFAVAALRDAAVATSGDQHAAYALGGRAVGHVIDPRTGQPTAGEVGAATVIAPSAGVADGWATALLVLGEPGLALAARAPGVHAAVLVRSADGWALRATAGAPIAAAP